MLTRRLFSAILLIPLVVVLAWLGHPWLTLFLAVALGLAAWEFIKLAQRLGHNLSAPLTVAAVAALALERGFPQGRYQEPLLAALVMAITMRQVLRAYVGTRTEAWGVAILVPIYVGYLGAHLVALRALPNGLGWLALTAVTVWVADTGAYVVGSKWGRHKLAPAISPGKSWEGIGGALVTGVIAGLVVAQLAGIPLLHGLVLSLLLVALTPFSDLAKSMLKRQVGVKDSSNLIPGHGGALDRLDSLLFAGAIAYYYATLIALRLPPAG